MGTSEGAFCCLILKHPIPVILNKRREREMGQQENKRKERDGTTGIGHLGSFDGDAVNQNIIEETNRNLVEILSDSDLSNPDGRDPLDSDSDSNFGLILAVLGCQFSGFEMLG
jgi:hypothetical protein